MAVSAALLVFLFVLPAAFATDYTVGDTAGWDQGPNYNTWVSGKTFKVGDNLVFTYGGSHSVDEVSKSNYDSCNSGSAIKSYTGGSTTIPLTKTGSMYFLCPALGHCSGGMKLAVTVSAAGTTPTTPATPTPTTPSTNTPTPGSSTPTTPAKPSAATSNLFNMNIMVLGAVVVYALMG